jgi:pimeloyl-ACP methyl ester carboxylesterase
MRKEMSKSWEIPIEGHHLAAVSANSTAAGIPVVFLHCIGSSIFFWTPDETSLFDKVRPCYSLSLPGHYPARFPPNFGVESLTAELMAQLFSGAIREIVGNQKVLLVGHSTGGFAALSTAIYAPEVVSGVICIAGFAKGQWTGALGFNQWLVRQGSLGRDLFKQIYKLAGQNQAVYRALWLVHANDRTALLANPHFNTVINSTFPHIRKLDLGSMLSYFTVMPQIDITPLLSKINVPTCVIAGDRDPTVPPIQSYTIARKVAGANLAVIKGAGHLPFFEKPMEYKRIMETWVAKFQSSI